ncbi:DUF6318 family protein [Rothia sp. P13129]|uniref:DUF6318 family protein n=1 Tax=Rothia sp. P13129 TaxID=3402664 RepID=UPI003AC721DC
MNSPSASMTASVSPSASSSAGTSSTSESENVSTSPDDVNESGLTAEEQKKVDAGEYVAASVNHRAFNVPKPVFPEAAREETLEGALAFLDYWLDMRQYAVLTGDISGIKELTDAQNVKEHDFYQRLHSDYASGNWLFRERPNTKYYTDNLVISPDGIYRILISTHTPDGTFCEKDRGCSTIEGGGNEDKLINNEIYYDEGRWVFLGLTAVEGIDYDS